MGIVVVLLAGCFVTPDEALWKRRAEARREVGPEASAADLGVDAAMPQDAAAEGGNCSAAGNPWPCDPVDLTGCAQGSCYVLPTLGQACVCVAGILNEGSPCNTTTLCKPGTLCAGTSPPGICRRVCRADTDASVASVCPSGWFCRYLTQHPSFGYCDLVPDAGPPDA
jgi:hypothetical protein